MATVCIIEDDRSIASMYRFKLEQHGFVVKVAHDGQEGFKLCRIELPELILLDLNMPVMNGTIMLEKLRATAWGAAVKVIILTNISKNEAPAKLRFLNVSRYIVKAHYTPTQIVAIIKDVLAD